MNGRIAASLGRLILLVVLAGSGAYVALSMYRWEWQRAIFAGLVFLGALGLVLFLVVLRRLDRLDQRIAQIQAAAPAQAAGGTQAAPYGVSAEPAEEFAWLGPSHGTYVFVPLLLGFGVVVSLLAVAVERLAGFVVGPAGSGGGATGARTGTEGTSGLQQPPRPRGAKVRVGVLAGGAFLLAVLAAGLIVPVLIDAVYDPEDPTPGQREMLVEVDARRVAVEPVDTVSALAVYCREQMQAPIVIDSIEAVDSRVARLTVHPRLAPEAQRRYTGCLQDLIMDRHLARVLTVQDVDG